MNNPILHLLGLAKRAGKLEIGEEPVGAVARAKQAKLIMLASDVPSNTIRRAATFGQIGNVLQIPLPYTKEEIGSSLGRNSIAMLALTDAGFAGAVGDKLVALDAERYAAAGLQLRAKADRTLARQKEKRQHEKNLQRGKGKPWAVPAQTQQAQEEKRAKKRASSTNHPSDLEENENFSKDGRNFSKDGRNFSKDGRNFSKDGRNFSKDGRNFSKDGRNFSKDGRNFSKDGRNFSKDGRNFSKDGRNFSKDGRNFSKDGRNFSKDGRNFSKDGGNFSKDGGNFSKDGRNFSKDGRNFSKDGRNFSKEGGSFSKDNRDFAKETRYSEKKFDRDSNQFDKRQDGSSHHKEGRPPSNPYHKSTYQKPSAGKKFVMKRKSDGRRSVQP